MSDLARLQADADACLAFLIDRQEEWGPTMVVNNAPGVRGTTEIPMALVAVPRRQSAWKAS